MQRAKKKINQMKSNQTTILNCSSHQKCVLSIKTFNIQLQIRHFPIYLMSKFVYLNQLSLPLQKCISSNEKSCSARLPIILFSINIQVTIIRIWPFLSCDFIKSSKFVCKFIHDIHTNIYEHPVIGLDLYIIINLVRNMNK